MANLEEMFSEIKKTNNKTRKSLKSSQWNSIELKDITTLFPTFETPSEFKWKEGIIGFIFSNFELGDGKHTTVSVFCTGNKDTLSSIHTYSKTSFAASYLPVNWIIGKTNDKETGEEKIQVVLYFAGGGGFFDKKNLANTNFTATMYYTNLFVDDVIETDVNSLALTMKQAKVDQEKLDLTLKDLIKVDQEKLDLTVNNITVDTENVSLWPTEIWGEIVANGDALVPRHDVEIINGIGQFTFVVTGGGGLFKHSTLIKFQKDLKITSAHFNTDSGGTINMGEPSGGGINLGTDGISIYTPSQWQGDISSYGLKATINGVVYDVTFTKTKPTKEIK